MQDAATLHLISAAQIYSAAGPARIRNMRILILLLIVLSFEMIVGHLNVTLR